MRVGRGRFVGVLCNILSGWGGGVLQLCHALQCEGGKGEFCVGVGVCVCCV